MAEATVSTLRRWVQRSGQILTVAALIFFARELVLQWGKVSHWRPSGAQFVLLISLAIGYAAALLLLAWNWSAILRRLIGPVLPAGPLLQSYTKTQIAKYVPGNVMHYVTRHVYLRDYGLEHRAIASAAFLEAISLPIAAMLAIALMVPFSGFAELAAFAIRPDLTLIAAILSIVTGAIIYAYFSGTHRYVPTVCYVLGRAVAFMLWQGLLFGLIIYSVSGTFVVFAIPVAIFAWLVGFVTPGAPGGVAVREVLIVELLQDAAPNEEVFIAALLFRLVTTLGDVTLYSFGELAFQVRIKAKP